MTIPDSPSPTSRCWAVRRSSRSTSPPPPATTSSASARPRWLPASRSSRWSAIGRWSNECNERLADYRRRGARRRARSARTGRGARRLPRAARGGRGDRRPPRRRPAAGSRSEPGHRPVRSAVRPRHRLRSDGRPRVPVVDGGRRPRDGGRRSSATSVGPTPGSSSTPCTSSGRARRSMRWRRCPRSGSGSSRCVTPPAVAPPTVDGVIHTARAARSLPGYGQLPLGDLLETTARRALRPGGPERRAAPGTRHGGVRPPRPGDGSGARRRLWAGGAGQLT